MTLRMNRFQLTNQLLLRRKDPSLTPFHPPFLPLSITSLEVSIASLTMMKMIECTVHTHPHQSSDPTILWIVYSLMARHDSILFHSFGFVVPILFCSSIICICGSWLYFCSCEWIKLMKLTMMKRSQKEQFENRKMHSRIKEGKPEEVTWKYFSRKKIEMSSKDINFVDRELKLFIIEIQPICSYCTRIPICVSHLIETYPSLCYFVSFFFGIASDFTAICSSTHKRECVYSNPFSLPSKHLHEQ